VRRPVSDPSLRHAGPQPYTSNPAAPKLAPRDAIPVQPAAIDRIAEPHDEDEADRIAELRQGDD